VKRLREHGLPAAWGLAEATLFFIVPDVLLTWLALERPKRALFACVTATLTALLGGALMFAWGRSDPDAARATMERLPGIHAGLIASVQEKTQDQGLVALAFAPLRGVPYKLYAIEWGAQDGSLATFLLVSFPARFVRFLLTTLLAIALRATLFANWTLLRRRLVLAAGWLAFYVWYFQVMAR
jgi:membrane protein DedA with SNARE-associated domain